MRIEAKEAARAPRVDYLEQVPTEILDQVLRRVGEDVLALRETSRGLRRAATGHMQPMLPRLEGALARILALPSGQWGVSAPCEAAWREVDALLDAPWLASAWAALETWPPVAAAYDVPGATLTRVLQRCPNLCELRGQPHGNFAGLGRLGRLESLDLDLGNATAADADAALGRLRGLTSLHYFRIARGPTLMGALQLVALRACSGLREVELFEWSAPPLSLMPLCAMQQLRTLTIQSYHWLDTPDANAQFAALPPLAGVQTLKLIDLDARWDRLGLEFASWLGRCRGLTALALDVPNAGVTQLQGLTSLCFRKPNSVDDHTLRSLRGLTRLASFANHIDEEPYHGDDTADCQVTAAGIAALAALPLVSLSLMWVDVDAALAAAVVRLPSLQTSRWLLDEWMHAGVPDPDRQAAVAAMIEALAEAYRHSLRPVTISAGPCPDAYEEDVRVVSFAYGAP